MKNYDHLFELERKLQSIVVRSDPQELSKYLAKDFFEFGSSGKVWTREAIIKSLGSEDGNTKIESANYKATELANDTVLVTYISRRIKENGSSISYLRSSIWKNIADSWQMIFHQGTPSPYI